jgi:hypothetical protein
MKVYNKIGNPSPKKYYMDFRSFGPYIFLVTDGPYTAMNYLLYICFCKNMAKGAEKWILVTL